jgi:hypothetical protein
MKTIMSITTVRNLAAIALLTVTTAAWSGDPTVEVIVSGNGQAAGRCCA